MAYARAAGTATAYRRCICSYGSEGLAELLVFPGQHRSVAGIHRKTPGELTQLRDGKRETRRPRAIYGAIRLVSSRRSSNWSCLRLISRAPRNNFSLLAEVIRFISS